MATKLKYDALGDAVTQRREQLHLSIRDASDLSRRIDEEVNGRPKRLPGIGDTTWTKVGQGVETKRYAHTLHLIDQTLRWPEGKAQAILHGEEPPEGGPADGPCPCARRHRSGGGSVDALLHPGQTVPQIEAKDRQAEVDLLRREVLRLIDRVEGLDEVVQRVLKRIDG